ncbi:MAG TPA: GNAT family N-acetyltransferase [Acidimicrobiales bacterium]|nr:GNAT family N-acetyltransferase [Acidimicrobiales bacterium]
MTDLEVRGVKESEWPSFFETVRVAFGTLPAAGDDAPEKRAWPIQRAWAAFDEGRAVGCAGAYEFDLTLPGRTTAPAAGVTWVGVRPTHRRRGALTGIMRAQLADCHARGEALAILLASESVIYGRFGYGLATTQSDFELDRRHARLADGPFEAPGRVRLETDEDTIGRLLREVHDRVRRTQTGDVSRPEGWWKAFFAGGRGGPDHGPRFHLFYEDEAGVVQGFAYYRIRAGSGRPLAQDWAVLLQGLGALTPDAYLALWQFVWDVDLSGSVLAGLRPPDEPLRLLLADPRRLATTRSIDFLWCRMVDVPAALAARRYAIEGSVVLEVRDPFCPWNDGRWRLDGGPAGASCVRADGASADLTLSAAELGAAYLGGTRLAALAAARRVDEHTPGALARADLLFAEARAPWCQTFF